MGGDTAAASTLVSPQLHGELWCMAGRAWRGRGSGRLLSGCCSVLLPHCKTRLSARPWQSVLGDSKSEFLRFLHPPERYLTSPSRFCSGAHHGRLEDSHPL